MTEKLAVIARRLRVDLDPEILALSYIADSLCATGRRPEGPLNGRSIKYSAPCRVQSGFVVQSRDVDDLGKRPRLLWRHPGLAKRRGPQTRRRIEHGYAWCHRRERVPIACSTVLGAVHA